MTGNGSSFVEWKEEFISQERGHRVVHYFLKESSGESILAVVGTERSVRHMFYVVSEEFVRGYGTENSIQPGFKWRSRREVVDWLTSMLSKQHTQGDWAKSPKLGSPQAFEAVDGQTAEYVSLQAQHCLSRNLGSQNSDIVWFGVAWTCGKHLKHYPAFCRNGTKISLQSFVFVMAKGQNHYLAYLEDMYEDKKGQKKVKVRWFHQSQEVKGIVPLRNSHPKEVFITPYSQVISAECVDGPATVLSREHFEDCSDSFPTSISSKVYLCFRQFRSSKIKPFDITKLHGYFDQPVICYLNSKVLPEVNSLDFGACEVNGEFINGDFSRKGTKRPRTDDGGETCVRNQSGFLRFKPSYLNSRNLLSGKRLGHPKQWQKPVFQVDEKIELLSQDSGIRGCWFRCTVIQISRKQVRVQYDDVQDEDEYGNLEEWIPSFRRAAPDKLGMRCSSRQTIRPAPPLNGRPDVSFEVGLAVDAWWSDGWWEGIVVRASSSSDSTVRIYFPGENFFLNVQQKDVRVSRDWVDGLWIDIPQKCDILSAVSEPSSPETKLNQNLASSVQATAEAVELHEELPGNALTCSDDTVKTLHSDDPCEEIHKFCDNKETHVKLEPNLAEKLVTDCGDADCRTEVVAGTS